MKVLVTYFSQTGNTEKIARAIQEEAAKARIITDFIKQTFVKED